MFVGMLPYNHTDCMVNHMKTTLNVDDTVMAKLKRESARTGRTMSELVESALRQFLMSRVTEPALPPLPTYHMGPFLVNIANREELYRAMEGDDPKFRRLYGLGERGES